MRGWGWHHTLRRQAFPASLRKHVARPMQQHFCLAAELSQQNSPHLRVAHVGAEQRAHQHGRHAQVGRVLQHLCGRVGWGGIQVSNAARLLHLGCAQQQLVLWPEVPAGVCLRITCCGAHQPHPPELSTRSPSTRRPASTSLMRDLAASRGRGRGPSGRHQHQHQRALVLLLLPQQANWQRVQSWRPRPGAAQKRCHTAPHPGG